jgi:TPR repeat protein
VSKRPRLAFLLAAVLGISLALPMGGRRAAAEQNDAAAAAEEKDAAVAAAEAGSAATALPNEAGAERQWPPLEEMEDPDEIFEHGFDLYYGRGVKRRRGEGMRWFLKAAELGHPKAQAHVGQGYIEGWGGLPKDPKQGIPWMRKAAEQNHPWAQMQLGDAYSAGVGVARDPEEALMWMALSAYGGGLAAKVMAPSYAKKLTPEQRKEGYARARQWRIDHDLPVRGKTAEPAPRVQVQHDMVGELPTLD